MSVVVEKAKGYIGISEKPKNSNKTLFGMWAKYDGVPWCGLFVSKCYFDAGTQLEKIGFLFPGFAGCQTAVAHFKKTGEITKTPQPGDIVFFDWNGDGRYDHTGIFVRWISATQFETVEGNTSLTNQSNGGQVMLRTRQNSRVLFVHPKVLSKPL